MTNPRYVSRSKAPTINVTRKTIKQAFKERLLDYKVIPNAAYLCLPYATLM